MPYHSLDTPADTRRLALILSLRLALHHGRFGGFTLTPYEVARARHHIARLEAEISGIELPAAA